MLYAALAVRKAPHKPCVLVRHVVKATVDVAKAQLALIAARKVPVIVIGLKPFAVAIQRRAHIVAVYLPHNTLHVLKPLKPLAIVGTTTRYQVACTACYARVGHGYLCLNLATPCIHDLGQRLT